MTTTQRPDYFGDMRRSRPRWNVEYDRKRAQRMDQLRRASIRAASAAYERDDAIRKAHAEGLSLRDIGEAIGVSHQRIHQIVAARVTA